MLEDTMEVTAMTRLRAAPPAGGSLRILFCKWGQDDYNADGDDDGQDDYDNNADGDEEEDEERDKKAEQDTVQPKS